MPVVSAPEFKGLVKHFAALPDPRTTINRHHLLVDVIVISICAVIAGADGPAAIEIWAKANKTLLKKYLRLPHGIPSHDTIGRVLGVLQPRSFQECFVAWLQSLSDAADIDPQEPAPNQIAIDGKALRGSHRRGKGLGPLHMVSAWATQKGISLGQVATDEKSNEITAIPDLLDRLELKDAVVTIDAAGCQTNIAEQIVNGGGDYLLALKGNQGTLHRAIETYFDALVQNDFVGVAYSQWNEEDEGHGRIDKRYYYQLAIPRDLAGREKWAGLKTFGVAIRVSTINGKETIESRFYISSLTRNARRFARLVRGHWGIENNLHWCLDMTFREDECRTRSPRLADNLAWLRRLALTLLKQHPGKESLVMKRRLAGWSIDFLMQVLTGATI